MPDREHPRGALGDAAVFARRRRRARLITWTTAMMTIPVIFLLIVFRSGEVVWVVAGVAVLAACLTAVAGLWLIERRAERELIDETDRLIRRRQVHGADRRERRAD